MKLPILFTAAFFSFFFSFAQSDFAPLGAEWYHNGYSGNVVYKSYAANDTMILGQSCRCILQKAYVPLRDISYARMYGVTSPLYIYGNEDTTFVYNNYYKRFTPLYVFNVSAGDTVRLNPIQSYTVKSARTRDTNEISFSFVVDSVKMVDYSGSLLKTVYSRALIEKTSSLAWSRFGEGSKDPIYNVYAQKIGSLYSGFLPQCVNNCITLGSEGGAFPDTLLCYKDDILDVHLISGACDKDYIFTGIKDISLNKNQLQLRPNPASSLLFIDGADLDFKNELSIYNAFGQKVLFQNFEAKSVMQINVSSLADGLYFIRLKNLSDNSFTTGKFIKN